MFPHGYSLQSYAVRQGLKKQDYTNISENINKKQIEFMTNLSGYVFLILAIIL